jgi:hypothetical protein
MWRVWISWEANRSPMALVSLFSFDETGKKAAGPGRFGLIRYMSARIPKAGLSKTRQVRHRTIPPIKVLFTAWFFAFCMRPNLSRNHV